MKRRPQNPIGFLKTTAIGGLLFLLPLVVVGALIGQIVPIVMTIAQSLGEILPGFLKTPGGLSLLVLLAIAVLLLMCFAAGLVARWSLGKRLSEAFEKNLLLLFPRYAIIKEQMTDSIGGDRNAPRLKPVLVQFDEWSQIAFETERSEESNLVSVYLPGSPDPWSGKVVLVGSDRVQQLVPNFGDAAATCEQLGRGAAALLAKSDAQL
jgi:uncharacterized membrane protein